MRISTLLIPTLLIGCGKPPAEAPAELAALGEFLWVHYEDEDAAEFQAGLANLFDFLETEDYTIDIKDRAVTMPILTGEGLGSVPAPPGVDPESQIPIALARESAHGIDANRELATEANRICIESTTTVWAQRAFDTDAACFGDGSCDTLAATQETRKENALAKVWYDQSFEYRVLDFEGTDGEMRQALIQRGWIEEQSPGDGGNTSWDQLFALDVVIEADGGSLGWTSYWSSITVTGINDGLYSTLVRDGIDEANIHAEEFMSGVAEPTCGLDRAAEKPERQ